MMSIVHQVFSASHGGSTRTVLEKVYAFPFARKLLFVSRNLFVFIGSVFSWVSICTFHGPVCQYGHFMERNSALHRFPLQLSSHSRANSAANIHFCTVIRSSISPEHSPKSAVATIPCRARPLNCKNFPYDRQEHDRLVNTARPLLHKFPLPGVQTISPSNMPFRVELPFYGCFKITRWFSESDWSWDDMPKSSQIWIFLERRRRSILRPATSLVRLGEDWTLMQHS